MLAEPHQAVNFNVVRCVSLFAETRLISVLSWVAEHLPLLSSGPQTIENTDWQTGAQIDSGRFLAVRPKPAVDSSLPCR